MFKVDFGNYIAVTTKVIAIEPKSNELKDTLPFSRHWLSRLVVFVAFEWRKYWQFLARDYHCIHFVKIVLLLIRICFEWRWLIHRTACHG